jgi:hypothetical protein
VVDPAGRLTCVVADLWLRATEQPELPCPPTAFAPLDDVIAVSKS